MKKPFSHLKSIVVFATITAGLSSCSTMVEPPPPPPPVAQKKPEPFKMYEWNGDNMQGAASIKIYLDKQRAEFYKGDQLAGWSYVATGRPSHPTPTGSFRIMEKTKNKSSNLYGKLFNAEGGVVDSDFDTRKGIPEGHRYVGASMPYFMRLTGGGVGMHIGPIPRPGRTASHGCIRVPRGIQPIFFENSVIGTPVTILAKSPEALTPEEKAELAKKEEEKAKAEAKKAKMAKREERRKNGFWGL